MCDIKMRREMDDILEKQLQLQFRKVPAMAKAQAEAHKAELQKKAVALHAKWKESPGEMESERVRDEALVLGQKLDACDWLDEYMFTLEMEQHIREQATQVFAKTLVAMQLDDASLGICRQT